MTTSETERRQRPNLNPAMLRWAREWRGRTLEEAARRVHKSTADIEAWEKPKSSSEKTRGPTVKQARELAALYDRSFLEFFRAAPPPAPRPELVPDFRLHRTPDPRDIRELELLQAWAEEKRINALDLFQELGEEIPEVPTSLFVAVDSDVEAAAENARHVLKFEISEQFGLKAKDKDQLPTIIRRKMERGGILTMRRSDLWEHGARGMCIFATPLPIVVHTSEAPGAQAFTLSHEIGHVALRQSGISGPIRRDTPYTIEKWCNRFAASFLMPRTSLMEFLGTAPAEPARDIADDQLSFLAGRFRVSQHAMLIRLVHLGYVNGQYYWGVKKPLFDEQEENYKSQARSKYYASRYKSTVGDLYTGLVLEAWSSGRITNHNAAEYMGIKSFEHLFALRDHFGNR